MRNFQYDISPYCIDKVLEDEAGEYIYYCRLANLVTIDHVLGEADYGYQVGFKIAEIEDYEKKHPEVLYKIKAAAPRADVAVNETQQEADLPLPSAVPATPAAAGNDKVTLEAWKAL